MRFRTIVVLAISILISGTTYGSERRRAISRPQVPIVEDSRFLAAAEETAAWLTTLEIPSGDGLRWPRSAGTSGGGTGIEGGSAGIAAFFLRMYEVTRDPRWLEKAEGGARHVATEYAAGRFAGHDWLSGAAGGGDFLLEMHARTSSPVYLDGAVAAGEWLLSTAIVEGDGVYWRHHPQNPNVYTGVAHGAAGVGLFLVDLYRATQDARYLHHAERAFRWMKSHQVALGEQGIGWKRLTTDQHAYNGWCGGAVGAAAFLLALHGATGKSEYYDAWLGTIEGLYRSAVLQAEDPLRLAWRYDPAATSGRFPSIYCHGVAGVAVVLAEASRRTGEPRYAEWAKAGGRWLDSVARPHSGGRTWQHIVGASGTETGLITGAASVGHASLRMFALDRQAEDLDRAVAAAEFLLAFGDAPAPGLRRWLNRTDNSSPPRYDTGWYTGAAGIGIFLLELHDTLRGLPPGSEFSVLNP
jgi:rhamnogalacturonyl hydrolase YesR